VLMLIDGTCYADGNFDTLVKMKDAKVHEFFSEAV
jgi:hypothetical protein